MARLSTALLSLCLLLPTSQALPKFWPHGFADKPYPSLTLCPSDGVWPTGSPGTTGTGTGTGYYPTATGSAYYVKRDAHPPYPPPAWPAYPTSGVMPTAPTGVMPTGTGTGTGFAYPTYAAHEKRDVDAAKQTHRAQFEGPRKRHLEAYYPYEPSDYYYWPTATGTGMPTGTMPVPMPTGTVSGGGYMTAYW